MLKDLRNLFFILRTIKKEKQNKNSLWYKFKMNNNWIGVMYAVINLSESQAGEDEDVRHVYIMKAMSDINEYMGSLGFFEIIHPDIVEIDRFNYLITYSPIFRKITVRNIIRLFIFLCIIIFLCIYFIKK